MQTLDNEFPVIILTNNSMRNSSAYAHTQDIIILMMGTIQNPNKHLVRLMQYIRLHIPIGYTGET